MERFIEFCEYLKRRFVPIHFDSTTHPAETYYTSIYMDRIQGLLEELNERSPLDFLDAGCGTGRFLVPFAKLGHRMTGIDYHKDSLRIANQNAQNEGVQVRTFDGNFESVLQNFDDHSFDAAMCLEALYTSKNRTGVTQELMRVLRPGGMLFITHRTRFYYVTQALAKSAFDDALLITEQSEGRLLKKAHRIHYNWQSKQEIESLYEQLGMPVRHISGIGPYTGCESDPKATICDPATLNGTQREKLKAIEDTADPETMMASRYVLVATQKPTQAN